MIVGQKGVCVRFLFVCLLFLSSGCVYSRFSLLPKNVHTIHIENFINESFSFESNKPVFKRDLDSILMDSLADAFLYDGRLKLVDSDEADWCIAGKIKEYRLIPLTYSIKDSFQVQEFRAIMTLSLTLKDSQTGKILWSNKKFKCWSDFFVSGAHLDKRKSVLYQICRKIAHNIVVAIFEGWYR